MEDSRKYLDEAEGIADSMGLSGLHPICKKIPRVIYYRIKGAMVKSNGRVSDWT